VEQKLGNLHNLNKKKKYTNNEVLHMHQNVTFVSLKKYKPRYFNYDFIILFRNQQNSIYKTLSLIQKTLPDILTLK